MKAPANKTTWLSIGLAAFLLGLGLAKVFHPDTSVYMFALSIALFLFIVSKRFGVAMIASVLILSGVVGNAYGQTYYRKLKMYDGLFGKNIELLVKAKEDAVYSKKGQLTFRATDISFINTGQHLIGTISIEGMGAPMVYKGDYVRVSGKLYLRRSLEQGSISYAQMSIVTRDTSTINQIRRKFIVGLQNALPEPMASLAAGILIGQRSTLPDDFNEQLIKVGLIHIVAVSGFNLTIIVMAIRRLLAKQSRYQVVVLSCVLVGLFLLFTNFEPSIVRASWVSVLSLLAWYYGRSIKPVLLLLLVACITATINPLYIWFSVGWYLSFAAFFGIIVLAPLIKQRCLNESHQNKVFPSIMIETMSAQLCTLPLLLFVFGRMQNISLIANLLVAPFVPFAMLCSFLAGISGVLGPLFITVFAAPAKMILDYIISITLLLGNISFAQTKTRVTFWQMLYFYILLLSVSFILWTHNKKSTRIINIDEK